MKIQELIENLPEDDDTLEYEVKVELGGSRWMLFPSISSIVCSRAFPTSAVILACVCAIGLSL